MHEDAEVQMIAARKAGCTGKSDDVSLFYRSADVRLDFTHMGVEGLQAKPVVDDDEVAENTEGLRKNDLAVIRCGNRRVGHGSEILSHMRLLVDFRPIVHIRALIAKRRFGGRPRQALESAAPQHGGRGIFTDFQQGFLIGNAHFVVDPHIPFKV